MYYVAFRWDYYAGNFMEMIAIWHGGLAIHGGIIGALIALYFFAQYKKASLVGLADSMVPWLLFGQSIGRVGNLANGEAHGVPTIVPPSIIFGVENRFRDFWSAVCSQTGLNPLPESISKLMDKLPVQVGFEGKIYELKEYVPWGMSFGNYKRTPAYSDFGALPVHPTFIYEMVLNFACFVVLYILWRKDENIGSGRLLGYYLIFYGFIRAFVTFFRADDLMVGYLRAPHLISIIMVFAGILIINRKKFLNSTRKNH
jgi:phosphatidylglycerol:prolipoprotein diacylglycerol transferase